MKHHKPDLLVVLTLLLGCAVVMTTYGERFLKALDVQAHTTYGAKPAQP